MAARVARREYRAAAATIAAAGGAIAFATMVAEPAIPPPTALVRDGGRMTGAVRVAAPAPLFRPAAADDLDLLGAMAADAASRQATMESMATRGAEIINYSATHAAAPSILLEASNEAEVQLAVSIAHTAGQKMRVVGTGLSPNGLGFSDKWMLSLADMNKVLDIDTEKRLVRVQAGARVADVVDVLRPHGLTLENFASINDQQMGGLTQAGAHGTGATIPPIDDSVVSMRIVTPGVGTLELSDALDPKLFRLAKCGIGGMGVVTELTMRCVPLEQLTETTAVVTREVAVRGHSERLRKNRHVRYMWIPYEDAVVIVTANPAQPGDRERFRRSTSMDSTFALQPLADVVSEATGKKVELDESSSFAQLRDAALAADPLDVEHVKRVNAAEAEFFRRVQGITDIGDQIQVLSFECGGQQWVNEVCFPAGTLASPSGADMEYMAGVLAAIEDLAIAAPSPIEQRWTASSTSVMSPAHDPATPDTMFSWVGIIMYLCSGDATIRKQITDAFEAYRKARCDTVDRKYGAIEHWAKLEIPEDGAAREELQRRLAARYPLEQLRDFLTIYDPKAILANRWLSAVLASGDE